MFISSFIASLAISLIASLVVGLISTNAVAAVATFFIVLMMVLSAMMIRMASKSGAEAYADLLREGC